jgi:hypothetical protein
VVAAQRGIVREVRQVLGRRPSPHAKHSSELREFIDASSGPTLAAGGERCDR